MLQHVGEKKSSTEGGRARKVNHDLNKAASFENIGPTAFKLLLDGLECPDGKENRSHGKATKLVRAHLT